MSFLSQIFDFMFAPAGTFDPASAIYDAANDSSICNADSDSHHDSHIAQINPATGWLMNEGNHIDIMGNPYGVDLSHHHDDYPCANDSSMFSHDNGCSSSIDSSSMFDCDPSSFDCDAMFDKNFSSGGSGSGCD